MSNKVLLNSEQQKAVEFKTGAHLVVAGAGTGKTRVITERIKHLLQKEKIDPQEVLALTFTEKAASEMLLRLMDVMPLGYQEPWVYTFHSFADRVLKKDGLEIGLDPGYKILPTPEQWLLFRRNLFDFELDYFRPRGNPTKFISAILRFISRLQDENISPEELSNFAKNFAGDLEEKTRWEELAHVYEKYQELKISQPNTNAKLDFGDLITWTTKLFTERPNILKHYQQQFKHVLIDEFQDTNYAQYELIKLLCPQDLQDRSLLVVGDDSQSIYKFRGAAVSNILEFMEDYPKAEMTTLTKNYRSTQEILDPSYKLIQNNNPDTLESKLGISKELASQKKSDTKESLKPKAVQLKTLEDEVDYVVLEILSLLAREPEYTYKDIAIMARANNHLDPFVMALRKYGLPYQLVGNRGLYDREEVRDIIALLRVIVNPKDSISLYRTLNIDSLNIPQKDISNLLTQSRYQKKDMWELMTEVNSSQLQAAQKLIEEYQDKITKESPSEFVFRLVSQIKYVEKFVKEESIEDQLSLKNLNIFLDIVKKFEVDYRSDTREIPTIIDFLDHLEILIDAGDNPAQAEIEDIDTINLLTIHASKGLEFPVVFMINLVGGRFPTRSRKDIIEIPDDLVKETLPEGDAHIQEERRLFYVGMTRAEKYLYMVTAKNYGGKREKVPTGYINETGLNLEEIALDDIHRENSQTGLFGVESGFRDAKAQKISKGFEPPFLSYSQVDTYKICPLRYKYRYILNVPTPPNSALSFGITIHDTLRDFHNALRFQKDVGLDDLYDMYQRNWQPLGYMDEKHRQNAFEDGKVILKNYYEKHINDIPAYAALEKSFNLKIDGIKFYGKIDRIDFIDGDKTGESGVEIIDYKTGASKDQKYVDKDDQVAFYAIAAKDALGMEPKKLSYYYVETGEKFSTERTDSQLEKKKDEVKQVVKNMREGDFAANPGMHCDWCDYKEICPFALKK